MKKKSLKKYLPKKQSIKKYLPKKQSIKEMREFKVLKPLLKDNTLWTLNCQTVSRGVAAGLAGAVIPGFQLLYGALLAILLRGNLPVALAATLVTNPFTAVPVIYFVCLIGGLITGNGKECSIQNFNWDVSSFHAFWANFSTWIMQFGKAYIVGVPIVSVCLGVIGYFATILIWKTWVYLFKK